MGGGYITTTGVYGTPYGYPYNYTLPAGAIQSANIGPNSGYFGYDLSNVKASDFFLTMFPVNLGLNIELAIQGEIQKMSPSNNVDFSTITMGQLVNQYGTSIFNNLEGLNGLFQNTVGNMTGTVLNNSSGISGVSIDNTEFQMNGLQSSLIGDGSSVGALNFTTNMSVDSWGTYYENGITAHFEVQCPLGINSTIVPNIPTLSSAILNNGLTSNNKIVYHEERVRRISKIKLRCSIRRENISVINDEI